MPSITAVVTFWIRQDCQHTDLPRQVAQTVNRWILEDWPLDGHVFRILPTEKCTRPYLWFAPQSTTL